MIGKDKKLSLLYILDILEKYTDENHSLTYSEIDLKLNEDYGIKLDNKTIAKYVNLLAEYGTDIRKKGNNGCAIVSRDLDNSALSFLVDAIFSSKSISSQHAQYLIQTLLKDSSIYERKRYAYIYKADEIVRTNNKEIFYTIDTIARAIEENRQISFTYNEVLLNKKQTARFNGKRFTINPYFLINNRGKYYLVCNYDKYNSLSNYKVECISNIKILDTKIKPMQLLDDVDNFDIGKYVNEHIYMFSGKSIQATIKINNIKILNDIVDWFGENIIIKEKGEDIYVTLSVNEQAFLYWAMQYGQNIEIVKPVTTREKYIEMVEEILKKYKG